MPRFKDNLLWCSRCKRYRAKKHFARNRASKDGLHRWCRDCCREYSKMYQTRKRAKAKEVAEA